MIAALLSPLVFRCCFALPLVESRREEGRGCRLTNRLVVVRQPSPLPPLGCKLGGFLKEPSNSARRKARGKLRGGGIVAAFVSSICRRIRE